MKHRLATATSLAALLIAAAGRTGSAAWVQPFDPKAGDAVLEPNGQPGIFQVEARRIAGPEIHAPPGMMAALPEDDPAKAQDGRPRRAELTNLIGVVARDGGRPGGTIRVTGERDLAAAAQSQGQYVYTPGGSRTASVAAVPMAGNGGRSAPGATRMGTGDVLGTLSYAPAAPVTRDGGAVAAHFGDKVPSVGRQRTNFQESGGSAHLSARLAAAGFATTGPTYVEMEEFVLSNFGQANAHTAEWRFAAPLDTAPVSNPGLTSQSLILSPIAAIVASGTPTTTKTVAPPDPGSLAAIGNTLSGFRWLPWR